MENKYSVRKYTYEYFLIQRVINLKNMFKICFGLHRCETQQPQKLHPFSYK